MYYTYLCILLLIKKIIMKKLLVLTMTLMSFVSCTKEQEGNTKGNIIGVKCSDGALIPGNSPSICSATYVYTYSREIIVNGIKTGKWETVKENKTHGTFVSFLYGKGTFCDNYPSSIYCLGKNY